MMPITQKTIYIIKHDKKTLPVLDYIDIHSFLALAMSGGIILWVYKGMAMLIPTARIENLARIMESIDKQDLKKTKSLKIEFTTNDAIILPKKIAAALFDD